ncbi:MAG: biotin synthase BioB [Chromatiales bacterium]|jgi:biotin synthase|nr:biotin synthase BioB [Chromatiales bacterium]
MTSAPRNDWTVAEVTALYEMPFNDLLFQAQGVHREFFDPHEVQISTLLSIKTGACPEDCSYCPQSVRFDTNVDEEPLLDCRVVIENAKAAKAKGATRFCMGAAYRSPKPKQVKQIAEMIKAVNDLGMETCATLGMLTPEAATELKDAGLDYYNHNLDSSESFYKKIITTRTFQHRLDTLKNVRDVGMKICCGGIIGMGEEDQDRIELLHTLATMPEHPGSVPINQLVAVEGTPLEGVAKVDGIDFVRTIAVARILMPATHVRLSAGRTEMSDETQAMCFFAGANSIFYGEKLLTTENPDADKDLALMKRLGLRPEAATKDQRVEEQRQSA